MKTFAVSDYGLYVTSADFEAYAETHNTDAFELLTEVGNYYSDTDGECCLLLKDDESFSCDDSFAILPLENSPTLFTQAYESEEEALNELKEKYVEYLPDDFDYEGKFVSLVGTTFG
jgi:hypothetical protein